MLPASAILNQQEAFISIVSAHTYMCKIDIVHARPVRISSLSLRSKFSLAVNSSSPTTADVTHVTISVTMFPVLYLVMFSVTAFSGSGSFRGRNRVTKLLAWLMARDWTASAVKSATCTPSTSSVYHPVG